MLEKALHQALEAFCAGFQTKDPEAVLAVFAEEPDIALITSEDYVIRGPSALRTFLQRYAAGPITYSWEWSRVDTWEAGDVGWLFAEGQETAATAENGAVTPYRLTMVLRKRAGRSGVLLLHGSSPYVPSHRSTS